MFTLLIRCMQGPGVCRLLKHAMVGVCLVPQIDIDPQLDLHYLYISVDWNSPTNAYGSSMQGIHAHPCKAGSRKLYKGSTRRAHGQAHTFAELKSE